MRKGVQCVDKRLTEDEFEKLYAASRDIYDELFILLAGEVGMRANEIAFLHKGWIDKGKGRINIPLNEDDRGWSAKNTASRRSFPVRKLRRRTWSVVLRFFEDHDEVDRNRQSVGNRIRAAGKRCGIDVFPHALRSTASIALCENIGANPWVLKRLMGWKHVSSSDPYVDLSDVAVDNVIDKYSKEE